MVKYSKSIPFWKSAKKFAVTFAHYEGKVVRAFSVINVFKLAGIETQWMKAKDLDFWQPLLGVIVFTVQLSNLTY